MRNTVSWSCDACGEYNAADLKDKAPTALRCAFCFHPVQSIPSLEPKKPRMRLSDEWLGDEIIKPLFGKGIRKDDGD
ncbi:MAG TPA: hypothetical protein VKH46_03915 [Thermoanaerobaculia bacterium]|jgi:hypothetical protein|nr:hypothetical protein [Thermoanaerobaculia bacterium]